MSYFTVAWCQYAKLIKSKDYWPCNFSCLPLPEWYWECVFRQSFYRFMAVVLCLLSVAVVWSECTFFSTHPVLSLFAVFVEAAEKRHNYICIEVRVFAKVTWLKTPAGNLIYFCPSGGVLCYHPLPVRVRLFDCIPDKSFQLLLPGAAPSNWCLQPAVQWHVCFLMEHVIYTLYWYKRLDYSKLLYSIKTIKRMWCSAWFFHFSRLFCRLTPPLCLNFLGLLHMDSAVSHRDRIQTSYTSVGPTHTYMITCVLFRTAKM